MTKLEQKIEEEFIKNGVHLSKLRELKEFLRVIHDFTQYLGTNQYYSDALNKKIFLLNLDADTAVLKIEALGLRAASMRERVEESILSKKKKGAEIGSKEVKEFNNRLQEVEKEILSLHSRALEVTEDIRREHKQKL